MFSRLLINCGLIENIHSHSMMFIAQSLKLSLSILMAIFQLDPG